MDYIVAGARAGVMGFFAVVAFALCVMVLGLTAATLEQVWERMKGGGKR